MANGYWPNDSSAVCCSTYHKWSSQEECITHENNWLGLYTIHVVQFEQRMQSELKRCICTEMTWNKWFGNANSDFWSFACESFRFQSVQFMLKQSNFTFWVSNSKILFIFPQYGLLFKAVPFSQFRFSIKIVTEVCHFSHNRPIDNCISERHQLVAHTTLLGIEAIFLLNEEWITHAYNLRTSIVVVVYARASYPQQQ